MSQSENVNLILNLMLTSVGKHTNKPNNNKNNNKTLTFSVSPVVLKLALIAGQIILTMRFQID